MISSLSATNLFWSVDDEVTAGIEGALVQLCQISIRHSVEKTVSWTEHDWDLADESFLMLGLNWLPPLLHHRLCDVNVEWGWVR